MQPTIDEKDREKVIQEISESQNRILQTFVPTIIAVGLISIADKENFALITLFSSFAILFGASLYISNLSYKIFRNAMFIKAVSHMQNTQEKNIIHWEKALSMFSQRANPPKIIGYETKTIGVIFIMFSLVYTMMFFKIDACYSILLGSLLLSVAFRIILIPSKSDKYFQAWLNVIKEYEHTDLNPEQPN